MICPGYPKTLSLTQGDLVELNDARGTTLRVTRGTLWLTQDQDTRDIVLSAGNVFTVERQGLTLAEAQDDATVCLVGPGAEAAFSRSRRIRVQNRLRAWLARVGDAHLNRRWVPPV